MEKIHFGLSCLSALALFIVAVIRFTIERREVIRDAKAEKTGTRNQGHVQHTYTGFVVDGLYQYAGFTVIGTVIITGILTIGRWLLGHVGFHVEFDAWDVTRVLFIILGWFEAGALVSDIKTYPGTYRIKPLY